MSPKKVIDAHSLLILLLKEYSFLRILCSGTTLDTFFSAAAASRGFCIEEEKCFEEEEEEEEEDEDEEEEHKWTWTGCSTRTMGRKKSSTI